MSDASVNDFLHSWDTSHSADVSRHLQSVTIEDDSIRDGLQGAFARTPTREQKLELLRWSAKVGSQAMVVGFPASSDRDFEDAQALIRAIDAEKLKVMPRCLARATPKDVECISRLNDEAECEVEADFFIGTSPLRRHIEGWDFKDVLARVAETSTALRKRNTPFGISVEDATRTPAADVDVVVDAAIDGGARVVLIADTVGAASPAGSARLVRHVLERVDKRNAKHVRIYWHGHNDRGLATANAIAAAEAGAHTISGTFTGIGERCGNTPLEQLLIYLEQAGSTLYNLEHIAPLCALIAQISEYNIPESAPLVGKQAFATSAGTHSAAVLKAQKLGDDFADLVFSGVAAKKLGRVQEIILGPTSGAANARYMLDRIGIASSPENLDRILKHAKAATKGLNADAIVALFSSPA